MTSISGFVCCHCWTTVVRKGKKNSREEIVIDYSGEIKPSSNDTNPNKPQMVWAVLFFFFFLRQEICVYVCFMFCWPAGQLRNGWLVMHCSWQEGWWFVSQFSRELSCVNFSQDFYIRTYTLMHHESFVHRLNLINRSSAIKIKKNFPSLWPQAFPVRWKRGVAETSVFTKYFIYSWPRRSHVAGKISQA